MRTLLLVVAGLLLVASSAAAQGRSGQDSAPQQRFRTCGQGLQWNMILWPQQRCTELQYQPREPAKLFDNVYTVGLQALTSILVTTSEGLVLIDTTFGETVDDVLDSIRKLGFDPDDIKYVLITHARPDHYGGAGRIKQLVPSARVAMSAADWEDAERAMRDGASQQRSRPVPMDRDLVVTDGQRIVLGDTTFTVYVTPGTTPGALSIEYPARDGNRSYRAMSTGALGMSYAPDQGEAYIKSMQRLQMLGPWEAWLPNHPFMALPLDIADLEKAVANRKPGQPHPGVATPAQVNDWLDLAIRLARRKMAIEAFAPRLATWPN